MRTLGIFLNIRNIEISKSVSLFRKHIMKTDHDTLRYSIELRTITEKITDQCVRAFPHDVTKSKIFSSTPFGDKLYANFSMLDLLDREKMGLMVSNNYKSNLTELKYHGSWINKYGEYSFEIRANNTSIITDVKGDGAFHNIEFSDPHMSIDEIIKYVVDRYVSNMSLKL